MSYFIADVDACDGTPFADSGQIVHCNQGRRCVGRKVDVGSAVEGDHTEEEEEEKKKKRDCKIS